MSRSELPRPQVCLEQEEGAVQGLECGGQEEQCRAPDQEQHWGLQVATVFTEGMLVDTVFSTTSKVVESVVPLCQGPGELSQLILYTAY